MYRSNRAYLLSERRRSKEPFHRRGNLEVKTSREDRGMDYDGSADRRIFHSVD